MFFAVDIDGVLARDTIGYATYDKSGRSSVAHCVLT